MKEFIQKKKRGGLALSKRKKKEGGGGGEWKGITRRNKKRNRSKRGGGAGQIRYRTMGNINTGLSKKEERSLVGGTSRIAGAVHLNCRPTKIQTISSSQDQWLKEKKRRTSDRVWGSKATETVQKGSFRGA